MTGFSTGLNSSVGLLQLIDQQNSQTRKDKAAEAEALRKQASDAYTQLKTVGNEFVERYKAFALNNPGVQIQIPGEMLKFFELAKKKEASLTQITGETPGYFDALGIEMNSIVSAGQEAINKGKLSANQAISETDVLTNSPQHQSNLQTQATAAGVNQGLTEQAAAQAAQDLGTPVLQGQNAAAQTATQLVTENNLGVPEAKGKANAKEQVAEFGALVSSGIPLTEAGMKLVEAGIAPGSPEYVSKMREALSSNTLDLKTKLEIEKLLLDLEDRRKAAKDAEETEQKGIIQSIESADSVLEEANILKKKVDAFSTGFMGALLSKVPGTDAYDVRQAVTTLQSNIAFDRLQKMRDQSKTGGALGQVSERELTLLQNSLVALDPNMSQQDFIRAITKVTNHYERFKLAVQGVDPDSKTGGQKKNKSRTRTNIGGSNNIGRFTVEVE